MIHIHPNLTGFVVVCVVLLGPLFPPMWFLGSMIGALSIGGCALWYVSRGSTRTFAVRLVFAGFVAVVRVGGTVSRPAVDALEATVGNGRRPDRGSAGSGRTRVEHPLPCE